MLASPNSYLLPDLGGSLGWLDGEVATRSVSRRDRRAGWVWDFRFSQKVVGLYSFGRLRFCPQGFRRLVLVVLGVCVLVVKDAGLSA